MTNRLYFSIFLSCFFVSGVLAQTTPGEYVNPNLGSVHSRWFFYTPAAHPFGMAKLGPTTNAHLGNKAGWEATGYDDRHNSIEGFAHLHEFQIGGIVTMPMTGAVKTIAGDQEDPDSGYRSRFRKENEKAMPGYYSVLLDDYNVTAELTATPRVGFQRYTFPESGESHILFDIGHRQGESGKVLDAFVRIVNDREVEGFVITHPEYIKNYQPGAMMKMYFVCQIDARPSAYGTFIAERQYPGNRSVQGPGAGLYLTYKTTAGEQIILKTGLSYTSTENARLNLQQEASDLSFDEAKAQAIAKWNTELGKISVEGGRDADKMKFYTGLYHAILGRGLASDVNGAYPKNDGGVGQIVLDDTGAPTYNHYNTDGIWGAFWNLTQVWALAYPRYYSEFVRCQIDHYKECGWLPDGIAGGKFVPGVGTNYIGLVVSSAYTRGIRDFDVESAYKAVLKNETGWVNRPYGIGRADNMIFTELGYVPYKDVNTYYSGSDAEGSRFCASHTLEYSFGAFAALEFEKALGRDSLASQLDFLSRGWERLFDESTGYIRPKLADGSFIGAFDPAEVWRGYQEANAYQYTFYVPHDPAGLISKIGEDVFVERLNTIFEKSEEMEFGGGKTIDAFSGLEGFYNHGNQPSLHISWLFNYAGAPWLTQHWVREICDVFYGTEGLHGYGYGQDEDQGQLGAWFVLAGMGLFDVQGGTRAEPTVQMSVPLFDKVTIELDEDYYPGKQFEIVVNGKPEKNRYIKKAALNGEPLQQSWIWYKDLVKGGKLELWLDKNPNKDWGKDNPPPSR